MTKAKSIGIMIPLVIATILAPPAQAQSDTKAVEAQMDEIRREVVQKRDSALSVLLEMNEQQAAASGRSQKSYDESWKKLGEEDRKLFREFSDKLGKLTAESASSIADRVFDLERERLTLQQTYFRKISDSVSPVIAAQFLQIQRQFETELRMAQMKATPLAK